MIEIKELSEQNFSHFLNLLSERGEAPKDFYQWKYLHQPYTFFPTGFIAYLDNVPVGCIGIINKIYVDENLVEHPATWFADWFVNDKARGKGIGLALMKKVYELSAYAFGIPGPEAAQIIAQKAGYIKQKNFTEIIIPTKPFLYGFKKYQSGFVKSILRAIKTTIQSGYIFHDKSFETLELTSAENLSFTKTKNSFLQTQEHFDWLMKMPVKEKNQRKWYKVSDKNSWMIIFVEDDSNNNKRARVIYDYNIEKIDRIKFIKKTRKRLAQMGVLYLQAYLFSGTKPLIVSYYLKPISQSASFHILNFTIAIIDMESRWRDFKMK